MPRVALVASHPIQYQVPWFEKLARVVDLEVFYCHKQDATGQADAGFGEPFDWDVPLFEGYRFQWLRNVARHPGVASYEGCNTPEIAERLRAGFDACIVQGWYLKSYLQAIRACRRQRIPVLLRGDSQLKTPRSIALSIGKYLPYRWFLSRIDAHLYVGRANHDYLRYYGVDPSRLFFVPHCVDNDRFRAAADRARAEGEGERLRAEQDVSVDATVLLFVGKLIDKKRPMDFVKAVARLRRLGRNVRGFVVGSGPLEASLREQAAYLGAPIHFLGFRNQRAIPGCYAAADCLVLPSDGRETWGLVVNEAMACGLPAVVSDAVGCGDDLIDQGLTGLTFPVGDVPALITSLLKLTNDLERDRGAIERAVAAKIANYTYDAAVNGTLQALASVAEPRRASQQAATVSS